jgi:hypothetical protein
MAVGLPLKTTYADGDVYSASDVNDTNGTINANVNPYNAGKNRIINGDFSVNQRNFSSTTTTGTFGFDRWLLTCSGGTTTYSKQSFSGGGNPVAGYNGTNYARVVTASQSAAGDFAFLSYKIEDARALSGQTVTISFWAKAASGTPKVAVALAPNQVGVGQVYQYGGQTTLSTSWARYSITMTLSTVGASYTAGYNELFLWTSAGSTYNSNTGSMGIQNVTIDFWGVQVEQGSTATAFQTATGTIQGELAACQRYYFRAGLDSSSAFGVLGNSGYTDSSTNSNVMFNLPVHMRTTPTTIDFPTLSTTRVLNLGAPFTPTNASLTAITTTADIAWVQFTCSGMTSGQFSQYTKNNSGTAYIGFSAEL